jgi:hypothetical protein
MQMQNRKTVRLHYVCRLSKENASCKQIPCYIVNSGNVLSQIVVTALSYKILFLHIRSQHVLEKLFQL